MTRVFITLALAALAIAMVNAKGGKERKEKYDPEVKITVEYSGDGGNQEISISPSKKVLSLKQEIAKKLEDFTVTQQKLTAEGKELDNEKTLKEQGITGDSSVTLTKKNHS